jgi:hypothetical protein
VENGAGDDGEHERRRHRECDGSSVGACRRGQPAGRGTPPPPRTEANFPRAPHLTRCRPPLQIQWFVLAGVAVVVCLGVSIFCFIKRKAVARRAAEFEAAKKSRRRSSTGVA